MVRFGGLRSREAMRTVRAKRSRAREARDTDSVWTLADDPDPDLDDEPSSWGHDDLGARDPAFRG